MRKMFASTIVLLLACAASAAAQPLFTDALPKEEFAAHRARVVEKIGDGVAILQGATEYPAYVKFRQSAQFFYVTGVEVPRAILVLDGRAKTVTLYLPPRNEGVERSEGPVLVPGEEAAALTGIPSVVPRERFAADLARFVQEGRLIYTPFRLESLAAGTPDRVAAYARAVAADPWDGRPSREAVFMQKIRAEAPQIEIRNLDPIIDEARVIKSPREIALMKQAAQIAGRAVMEAMRSASVGMYEYELEAIGDYVYKQHNAQGPAYFALVAAGKNAFYPHYHAAQSQLKDGDLVLWDWGPDYKYYGYDLTRMFPANGKFSADQRELYGVYVKLYQAIIDPIRPNVAPRDIIKEAVAKMDQILAATRFLNPKNKAAAQRFVDGYRKRDANRLGHYVGMEVHDVTAPFDTLKPGMMIAIEPAMTIPEDRVYIRTEDTILVTETGHENLSSFVPLEPAAVEKLMTEQGLAKRPAKKKTTH